MIISRRKNGNSKKAKRPRVWISKLSIRCQARPVQILTVCSYWAYKNAWSMDGLPGMQRGIRAAKTHGVAPIKKMVGPLAPVRYQSGYGFSVLQVVLIALLTFLIGLAIPFYGRTFAEIIPESIKNSPPDLRIINTTRISSLGSLQGLWSTR